MKNSKLTLLAFYHAAGIVIYVALIATILQNGEKIFGQMDKALGTITFLMLFVLSAAVTGALVLARPILLYLDGLKREAIKNFVLTVSWLFAFIIIFLFFGIVLR